MRSVCSVLGWLWLAAVAAAGTEPAAPGARLFKDIAVEPAASTSSFAIVPFRYAEQPPPLVSVGGAVAFGADDGWHGRELWRSEGTPSTTRRVRDLCPGPCGGLTSDPVSAGGRVFFSGTDGASGSELWVSDGSAAGTRRLTDVCWGPCDGVWLSGSGSAMAAGSLLFFAADEPGSRLASPTRQALWVSDGTPGGTRPITVAHQGFVSVLRSFGNRVVARIDSSLWVSDGTAAGTRPLAEVLGESPTGLIGSSRDGVLLSLGGPSPRWALIGSDLSVRPFEPCAGCSEGLPTPSASDLFVVLQGEELYRIEVTTGRSVHLAHLGGNGPRVDAAVVVGGRALMAIRRTWNGVPELWRSDGTQAGSAPLAAGLLLAEGGLAVLGEQAIFSAFREDLGLEPWRSDGTDAGTALLLDLAPGPASSAPWSFIGLSAPNSGRALFLVATHGLGAELFSTDGSGGGTRPLVEPRVGPPSSAPESLTALGDRLVFSAEEFTAGRELWASLGTPEATFRVADLLPGSSGSRPRDFVAHRGGIAFRAAGRLWKATQSLSSLRWLDGGQGVAAPVRTNFGIFTYGREVGTYCPVADGCSEPFVWRDATSELEQVRDIWPGWFDYFPITGGSGAATSLGVDPLAFRQGVVFGAHDGVTGVEPWFSDGTFEGTRQIIDLCVGPPSESFTAGSQPRFFRNFGERVVFATRAGDCPAGLAISDGTASGTRLLSQGVGEVADLLVVGRAIWSVMRTSAGDELWTSDGTVSGTKRVTALAGPRGERAFARRLTSAGRLVYFTVSRDDTGEELWRSDGSAQGTRALSIQAGRGSAAPSGLREIGGHLVFTADDGVHGAELWVSDGTRAGTRMVQDLAPGADSSWPSEFTRIGDRVYFAAADRSHGRELWSIELAALSPRSRSPSPSPR